MKLYLVYEAASIDPDNHLPACFKNIPRRLIATTDETKAIELLNEFRWVEEVDIPIDIRIPTAKGEIMVSENDPAYPGVSVDLITKSGTSLPLVVVESNPEERNNIVTYVFGNAMDENYTHKIRLDRLEEYKAGEKE